MALKRSLETDRRKFWSPLRVTSTLVVMVLLVVFGISSCNSNKQPTTSAPTTAPNRAANALPPNVLDAELKSVSGNSLKLSDYSGKVLLVNLWATWCGPCRMETPELVKLHKEYQDRGVELIGLSTEDPDASAESVAQFVKAYDVKYHIGWATREVALGLMQGRTNIPQSFIIARDGRIVRRFIGFSPTSTPVQLRQALEQALVEKS